MAIISLLALAADRVSILVPKLRRHQGQGEKRETGKKKGEKNSDEIESSREAAKKKKKALACQWC